MTSEQRARIQAEIDVLVGSCPPGDVDARAAMYIEQDALVDQGVSWNRGPRIPEYGLDGEREGYFTRCRE